MPNRCPEPARRTAPIPGKVEDRKRPKLELVTQVSIEHAGFAIRVCILIPLKIVARSVLHETPTERERIKFETHHGLFDNNERIPIVPLPARRGDRGRAHCVGRAPHLGRAILSRRHAGRRDAYLGAGRLWGLLEPTGGLQRAQLRRRCSCDGLLLRIHSFSVPRASLPHNVGTRTVGRDSPPTRHGPRS